MELVKPMANEQLTAMLRELRGLKMSSAFEVACGKCHVTRDVL